jgi:hypothetical protein
MSCQEVYSRIIENQPLTGLEKHLVECTHCQALLALRQQKNPKTAPVFTPQKLKRAQQKKGLVRGLGVAVGVVLVAVGVSLYQPEPEKPDVVAILGDAFKAVEPIALEDAWFEDFVQEDGLPGIVGLEF